MQKSNTYDQGVARSNTGYEKSLIFPRTSCPPGPPPWIPLPNHQTPADECGRRQGTQAWKDGRPSCCETGYGQSRAGLSLAQSADKKAMSGAKASESYVPQPNW